MKTVSKLMTKVFDLSIFKEEKTKDICPPLKTCKNCIAEAEILLGD